MQLIRGLHNVLPRHRACVATIGNFDGMHKGHQAIVATLQEHAVHHQLPSLVILFEPQPSEFFSGNSAPARLMSLDEKLRFLAATPIDYVLCIRFNEKIAQCSAHAFVEEILCDALSIKLILVGSDFRFGYKRKGDVALLKEMGVQRGFEISVMPDCCDEKHDRISSTRLRHCLHEGNVEEANALLGRRYALSGRVIYGQKRGRSIKVPTANICLKRALSPILGVYAVQIEGLEKPFTGVANVGNRPTVDGSRCLLEVHLFDFDKDIYHQRLTVQFLKKLRDEKRFDSFDALTKQIWQDLDKTRAFFKGLNHG